ncbi:MAG TPA: HEAT repeat domain-containing protein [Myxococcota bacterium]|nr:HEAT repeat domain-containing protein [Myxococcota bacterium]
MRRRVAAAVCAAALWSPAFAPPAAADGEPAAGDVHLIAALERGPGAAVLVFEAPRRVDVDTWVSDATIERSFYGGEAGTRVAVAWEELAHQRPVRFGAGDRVLCALESLPGHSIWRQRFPDPKERASTLTIAEKGDAFLRAPSLGALLVLQHYLALPAEMREHVAGVGYLVDLAAEAEPSFAAAAVERLVAVPHLDAQLDPSSAPRLVAALLRPDAPDDLVARLLALIRSGPLRALRPTLEAYAKRDALAPSRVYEALGRIDDGLPASLAERLLAVRDSEPLRAAGARFATGSALERLPRVLRSDPAPSVRGIAAQRWLAVKGIAGAPELRPALLDADRDVRLAALLALAQEGPEAVPTLRDALPAASPELAREIVAALSLAGGPQAVQALVELAETHPDPGVRLLAKSALGREIGHKD